jgi:hypothetical protein
VNFTAAGIILDPSAIVALPTSFYARTLVRVFAKQDRPIVVPALALTAACLTGRTDPAWFDPPEYTVTAVNDAVIPGLVRVVNAMTRPAALDVIHCAYEALTTGFPIVTAAGDLYTGLPQPVELYELH